MRITIVTSSDATVRREVPARRNSAVPTPDSFPLAKYSGTMRSPSTDLAGPGKTSPARHSSERNRLREAGVIAGADNRLSRKWRNRALRLLGKVIAALIL